MDDARLTLVNSLPLLQEFLTWLGESRAVLAIDTETEGLQFWNDDVRLIQVGDARAGWAFPWPMWAGPALEALKTYDGPIVMHNAKFDVTMIEEHLPGYIVPRAQLHDTMLMGHTLAPNKAKGLKSMCVDYMGSYASALQNQLNEAMSKQKWTWATVPVDFPMYWGYACVDTILTARLWETIAPQVFASGRKGVYDLEMHVSDIIGAMERKGARIDLRYCAEKRDALGQYVEEGTEWCKTNYGFGPGSIKAVTTQLIADGVPLWKKTKTGAWSLDDEVLEDLENQSNPLATLVRGVRKSQKIKSTYFDNFIALHHEHILHPSINQVGARTGRMSVQTPALQTLPRGTIVRDAFVPRDGHKLIMADSDQIEMRLLAHFSQDPGLIAAIMAGDLHTETARRVYGDPTIGKRDSRRQTAKNAAFAKVYMAGVEKFALTAGISVVEAAAFLKGYDEQFPGVRAFQQQVDRIAQARYAEEGVAYVTAPSGRHHPADYVRDSYKLVNYLIQGTAADVLKEQMVQLDMVGMRDYMVLPVHDEIVFDVPAEDVADVLPVIEKAMTITDGWAVPITVGVDGPYDRWGDKWREM